MWSSAHQHHLIRISIRASFHMSMGHLYVLFGEVSIQVLCPFFNWIFFLLWLSFISSLYSVDISPTSGGLAGVFSHSVGFIFILLMFSFTEKKGFSLM